MSPFSRGNMADIKTPWLRLLWFLAPFPPAAPYAEILGETNAQQEDYILKKLLYHTR